MPNPTIEDLEKKLTQQLNYGGIFVNGQSNPGHIEMVYQIGDLDDEVEQMKQIGSAFLNLANGLENKKPHNSELSTGKIMTTHELGKFLLSIDNIEVATITGYVSGLIENVGVNSSMLEIKENGYDEIKPKGVNGKEWLVIGGVKS